MKSSHQRVNNAKSIIALLILAIAFVIFYKFNAYKEYFMEDQDAMTKYVAYAFIGGGFLIGLLYLTSKTSHEEPAKKKAAPAKKVVAKKASVAKKAPAKKKATTKKKK